MSNLWQVEAAGVDDSAPCPCCGDVTRTIQGIVRYDSLQIAMYSVRWALARVPEHGAYFDLIVDTWREDTGRVEACSVSLDCRLIRGTPTFMIIDSAEREIAKNHLVSRPLNRADVIGDPLADDIFAICDVIMAQDERVMELIGTASRMESH
jgi:hypothetical protein